jgi:hypothetical protein
MTGPSAALTFNVTTEDISSAPPGSRARLVGELGAGLTGLGAIRRRRR